MRLPSHGFVVGLLACALLAIQPPVSAEPPVPAKYGSIDVWKGDPVKDSIKDYELRKMLDEFVPAAPTANAKSVHSTLLIFTTCYGGNFLDDFDGRAGTTVLTSNAPEKCARRYGYKTGAARALKAEDGWTSTDVHQAGQETRFRFPDPRVPGHFPEAPQSQGTAASLETTKAAGPIKNRHIIFYAGKLDTDGEPGSRAARNANRDTIKANFGIGENGTSADGRTTFTGAAGSGEKANGYEFDGSKDGLLKALKAVKGRITANGDSQVIIFVDGHGDQHPAKGVQVPARGQNRESIEIDSDLFDSMNATRNNDAGTGVSLFIEGAALPPLGVHIAVDDVPFASHHVELIDLDGDGDTLDVDEGVRLAFAVHEAHLLAGGPGAVVRWIDVFNEGDTSFYAVLQVDSGSIPDSFGAPLTTGNEADDTLSRNFVYVSAHRTEFHGGGIGWYDDADPSNICTIAFLGAQVPVVGMIYYETGRIYTNLDGPGPSTVGTRASVPASCPSGLGWCGTSCGIHIEPATVHSSARTLIPQDGLACWMASGFVTCVVTGATWRLSRCPWESAYFVARRAGSQGGVLAGTESEHAAFSADIDCGTGGSEYMGTRDASVLLGTAGSYLSSGFNGVPAVDMVPLGEDDDTGFVVSCLEATITEIDSSTPIPTIRTVVEDGVDWSLILDLDDLAGPGWSGALGKHLGIGDEGQSVPGMYDLGGDNDCDF